MSLREISKLALTSLIVAGSTAALLPLGCGSDDTKKTTNKATGGNTSVIPQSGAPGTGGSSSEVTAATGGSDVVVGSGGSSTDTGSAGSATGGASIAAAGATSLPNVTCASDIECKPYGLLCDTKAKKCVECLEASQCKDGKACIGGVCGGAGGCQSNADCASSADGKVCDVAKNRCVACLAATDCPDPAHQQCAANVCVTTCADSRECTSPSAQVCDPTAKICVECASAADCTALGIANATCAANHCRAGCTATADCTNGKICNTTATPPFCAECAKDSDCSGGKTCNSAGVCIADNCAGKTAKPCTSIAPYAGTPVIDGKVDDFCNVPAFELAFDSTAGKINQASGEAATATYAERATFRVGWAANALHAIITVADPSVNPNNNPQDIWNGDSVELMISTSQQVTGLTSADANTLHFIGNSTIGVTVKDSGNSGTATQITDPNMFKAIATAQGYTVELNVPWPASATVAAGTPIYFDAALNAARKPAADAAVARNAQAILYQGTTPASTSCTGTGNDIAPFCDDRLWCKTKFQ